MEQNVLLTLTGFQRAGDGTETVTEQSAEAKYYEQNGSRFVFYEETLEDGGTVKNRIKLKSGSLEVTKRGAVNSRMVFEEGRAHMTEYITPLGSLMLDVHTHSVETDQSDGRLLATADYTLSSGGSEISHCKISIKILEQI